MKYLLIGLNFLYLTVASSQNLEKINSIEEAESFIKLNPKAEITTLEISNDSLEYYKKRFLEKDIIDKYRIVKTEPIVSMRVSYIYLDGNKLTINKKRQEIIKLYKKGKSFGELATIYTMDSNFNKGDLGWFNEGVMHKTFEDAIKNHKKNDLFEVDITENKWYYVVLKTYDDLPKSIFYILSVID
ncbi:peptidylprolyl isomerase [Flavobacterium aquidurense]|uniref:PPIC-type PPIASE family protein n=1 Tax=Flavobacterium aquidurense TaxID=362413 RepID=A0A0Q1BG29_9FLAO|nr:peptidylprolyl isomerase [Flavobacterium aquidurense]KQB39537.1 PPIC-type PPIASE family protein [Flavobacterium aquidurense]